MNKVKKIVLIGETNVGKSSLVNRLIGSHKCIVGDVENLTVDIIDRRVGDVILVDTPGILKTTELEKIATLDNIDMFMVVCDKYSDMNLIKKMVKRLNCILVVNKQDTIKVDDVLRLPKVRTFFVSAKNGFGINQLREYLGIVFKEKDEENVSIAIVGRSNVGKSTLVNAILNKNKFKVEDSCGTTRDVAIELVDDISIADTPGYRKSDVALDKIVTHRLERYFEEREFIIGLVVISAVDGFTSIDKHIIGKMITNGFVVVCINKIDLVSEEMLDFLQKYILKLFPTVEVFHLSAISGSGVEGLVTAMRRKLKNATVQIKTSKLNKYIKTKGELDCVKYLTQTGPYSFKVFSKITLPENKRRFLEKSILEVMRLYGIQLKLDIVVG